ncbi:MAG: hypothetical protein Q7R40_14175 [Phaeospirillum sp.]|nr:hypothetical protein [Phaeospirillum sp.]
MDRRSALKTIGVSVFGAGLPLASSRAQDRHAKYRGQTVVVSVPIHPHYDAVAALLSVFTKETGIKVELDRQPFLRMKFKQVMEMSKPQGGLDLVCYVAMWKGEYVKKTCSTNWRRF